MQNAVQSLGAAYNSFDLCRSKYGLLESLASDSFDDQDLLSAPGSSPREEDRVGDGLVEDMCIRTSL